MPRKKAMTEVFFAKMRRGSAAFLPGTSKRRVGVQTLLTTNCSVASINITCRPNNSKKPQEMSGHSMRNSHITNGNVRLAMATNFTLTGNLVTASVLVQFGVQLAPALVARNGVQGARL